jgi:hypothetical protein
MRMICSDESSQNSWPRCFSWCAMRQEVLPAGVDIGEVAAAAARNADLLGQLGRMVDQHHALAALGRHERAHHAGRARADYHHIVSSCHPAHPAVRRAQRTRLYPQSSACT